MAWSDGILIIYTVYLLANKILYCSRSRSAGYTLGVAPNTLHILENIVNYSHSLKLKL